MISKQTEECRPSARDIYMDELMTLASRTAAKKTNKTDSRTGQHTVRRVAIGTPGKREREGERERGRLK